MISKEQRKTIEIIIWRLNQEVTKVRKTIPENELFGWKGDKK